MVTQALFADVYAYKLLFQYFDIRCLCDFLEEAFLFWIVLHQFAQLGKPVVMQLCI